MDIDTISIYSKLEDKLKQVNTNIIKCDSINCLLLNESSVNNINHLYTIDIAKIKKQYKIWHEELPNVMLYYSVKTNNDKVLLLTLNELGANFDCASIKEIYQILDYDISPEKIIYANTIKPYHELFAALKLGVKKLTFDNTDELLKIQKLTLELKIPDIQLYLRIKTNDNYCLNPLSSKFGVNKDDAVELLNLAYSLNLKIYGICFHVGSNNKNVEPYLDAIEDTAYLNQYVKQKFNYEFNSINLGGGWIGKNNTLFREIAQKVSDKLSSLFDLNNLSVLAEPGRFIATQVMDSAIRVISKKIDYINNEKIIYYYVSGGAYGLYFLSIYYKYDLKLLEEEGWEISILTKSNNNVNYKSVLFGPTCDAADKIVENISLPELNIGDYILIKNIGAYSNVLVTNFNQSDSAQAYYIDSGD